MFNNSNRIIVVHPFKEAKRKVVQNGKKIASFLFLVIFVLSGCRVCCNSDGPECPCFDNGGIWDGKKIYIALLFSTGIHLAATEIYRFYKARFQIEFLFRDAKQFTGLLDCQARCEQSLHFHFNASMTALNLIKMQDRQLTERSEGRVISVLSWKIRRFNEHLLEFFSLKLGLDLTSIKSNPEYENLINYGTIGA